MTMEKKVEEYSGRIRDEEKFKVFFNLLTEYNKKYNLTAITEEREVYIKHFTDSAAGEFLMPVSADVLEVGSGAGFPSLVLKILRPDLKFTLLESIAKKCEFLRVAVKELGHSGVEIVNARAEAEARGARRERYDVVCARAVARLNTLSEYCIPFVRKGGIFVAYKSGDEGELEESRRAIGLLGGRIEREYFYDLPEGYGKRSLVVVRKENRTPEKYPRGNGKERKNPL